MTKAIDTPYSHELNWPPHLRPFDPWDPAVQIDPFAHYAWMREHAPALRARTPAGDAWYLSRYRDVQWAFRTPKVFSSRRADPSKCPNFIVMDDPDHARLRDVVADAFRPKVVARMEDRVKGLVEESFRPLLAAGGGELMAGVIVPLTMGVIASLLGLPLSDKDQLLKWTVDFSNYLGRLSGSGPGSPTDEAGTEAFVAYMRRLLDAAPAEGDSLLSAIARARREGILSEDEANYFGPILFASGFDTTALTIGNGVILLAEMPHLLARLRAQPGDVPKFFEELIRFKSPAQRLRRLTTEAVEVAGCLIPARAAVFLLIGSANRDPGKFPHPEVFDLDRDTGGHLGFGFGAHSCIGSWLARMQARAVFQWLARTAARIELHPDPRRALVLASNGNAQVTGPKLLTVRLTPAG